MAPGEGLLDPGVVGRAVIRVAEAGERDRALDNASLE
jgi:hypothetical protein